MIHHIDPDVMAKLMSHELDLGEPYSQAPDDQIHGCDIASDDMPNPDLPLFRIDTSRTFITRDEMIEYVKSESAKE